VVLVRDEEGTRRAATSLLDDLRVAGMRVRLDDRMANSFGWRSVDWELKGVPIRIEVGPRDLAAGQVTLVRRDLREKRTIPLGAAVTEAATGLEAAQTALYAEALARQTERTVEAQTVAEAAAAASEGFAVVPWDAVGLAGEEALAAEGCSVRCLQGPDGSLPAGDEDTGLVAVVGKAY
jgi:prolyl-tRNA synthetase